MECAENQDDAPYLGAISSKAIGLKNLAEKLGFPRSVFSGGALNISNNKRVIDALKKNKNNIVRLEDTNIIKKEGGLFPLASIILPALTSFVIDKLYTTLIQKGNGVDEDEDDDMKNIKKLNKNQKIKEIMKHADDKKIIMTLQKIT